MQTRAIQGGAGRMRTAVVAALVIGSLAACAAPSPVVPSESSAPVAPPSSAAPQVDTTPVLVQGGTAEENLAYFDYVNGRVLAADADPGGAEFIAALADGGFDRSRMEVTSDTTAVDLDAASVQFSILLPDGCLIGQFGADIGYHSIVTPVLASGRCLIGSDRPAA